MKQQLKACIRKIMPQTFGVMSVRIGSFRLLGIGEGNCNYVFTIGCKAFICRLNIEPEMPDKSRHEFDALRAVAHLGIAPKAFYLHPPEKSFPYGFLILEFIDGKSWRMKKRTYTRKQIMMLATLLATLHNQPCSTLPLKDCTFAHYLQEGRAFLRSINRRNGSLKKQFAALHKAVKASLPDDEQHVFGIVHGDICPQNILETRTGLRLIDWESLQCSDPAKDVAQVLVDIGLKGRNFILFMKMYAAQRADPTLLERAKTYAVLMRYTYFLWELTRCFAIKDKKLSAVYLKKNTMHEHLAEAKMQYKRLAESLAVPELDVDTFFS